MSLLKKKILPTTPTNNPIRYVMFYCVRLASTYVCLLFVITKAIYAASTKRKNLTYQLPSPLQNSPADDLFAAQTLYITRELRNCIHRLMTISWNNAIGAVLLTLSSYVGHRLLSLSRQRRLYETRSCAFAEFSFHRGTKTQTTIIDSLLATRF